jgi:hypothetical protein
LTALATLFIASPASAQTFTDDFSADFNYAFGAVGGIWGGSENMSNLNGGLFNANISSPGVLTVDDNGSFDANIDGDNNQATNPPGVAPGYGWEGGRSSAPFLWREVPANQDFTMTVKVSSQTSGAWSAAGLLARAPSPTPPGPGDGQAATPDNNSDENFVSFTTFRTAPATPDEGNTLMKRIQGGVQNNDLSVGVNTTGTEPLPMILKLERIGGVGYRGSVSTDNGATFKLQSHTIPAVGNPLRDPAVAMQVGLAYQNFGTLPGTTQFDDFTLDVHNQLPAPGAPVLSASQTEFNVPAGTVIEQLITDSTNQIVEWARTPALPGPDGVYPNGLFLGAMQGPPAPPPDFLPAPPSNGTYFFWNTANRPIGETQTITITATNDWGQVSDPLTLTVRIIPEPGSLALASFALASLMWARRRFR